MATQANLGTQAQVRQPFSLKAWLEGFTLVAFFVAAFAISWTVWLTQPMLTKLDPASGKYYGMFAAYGPSIAAIVISSLTRPQRLPTASWSSRLILPAISLLASLVVAWDGISKIPSSQLPWLAALLLLLVNLLPAWIFWMTGSSIRGVRELLGSLRVWRVRWLWWLAAFCVLGVSYLIGYLILLAFGFSWPAFPRTELFPYILWVISFVFSGTFLYGGPLGEEAGWRGFALPRLQQRFDPLRSSLILGVIWGVWHFPLHVQGFYDDMAVFTPNLAFALLTRIGSSISLAILFTWLYNRTNGNLLLMVVFHTATNLSTGWLLPVNAGVYIGTILLTVTVVVWDRMWQRPKVLPESIAPAIQEGSRPS
jgi:uncharacterized protein